MRNRPTNLLPNVTNRFRCLGYKSGCGTADKRMCVNIIHWSRWPHNNSDRRGCYCRCEKVVLHRQSFELHIYDFWFLHHNKLDMLLTNRVLKFPSLDRIFTHHIQENQLILEPVIWKFSVMLQIALFLLNIVAFIVPKTCRLFHKYGILKSDNKSYRWGLWET